MHASKQRTRTEPPGKVSFRFIRIERPRRVQTRRDVDAVLRFQLLDRKNGRGPGSKFGPSRSRCALCTPFRAHVLPPAPIDEGEVHQYGDDTVIIDPPMD